MRVLVIVPMSNNVVLMKLLAENMMTSLKKNEVGKDEQPDDQTGCKQN